MANRKNNTAGAGDPAPVDISDDPTLIDNQDEMSDAENGSVVDDGSDKTSDSLSTKSGKGELVLYSDAYKGRKLICPGGETAEFDEEGKAIVSKSVFDYLKAFPAVKTKG